jgi:hypothetical protein
MILGWKQTSHKRNDESPSESKVIPTFTQTHTHMHPRTDTRVHTRMCRHTRTYRHTHTHTHTDTHTHIHTYRHTHTHTHTRPHSRTDTDKPNHDTWSSLKPQHRAARCTELDVLEAGFDNGEKVNNIIKLRPPNKSDHRAHKHNHIDYYQSTHSRFIHDW